MQTRLTRMKGCEIYGSLCNDTASFGFSASTCRRNVSETKGLSARLWVRLCFVPHPAMATPLLSPTSTLLISTAFTSSYVASVYLLPSTRVRGTGATAPVSEGRNGIPAPAEPTPIAEQPRDRNHPSVIKARLTCVTLSTALSAAAVPFLVRKLAPITAVLPATSALLGFLLPSTANEMARLVVVPLGLTMSLFAGSLYVTYLAECMPGQRWWSRQTAWKEFGGWQGLRNLVLVSPRRRSPRRCSAR